MAVREGFEPSMEFLTPYSLSRGAPSASRPSHRNRFVGGIIRFSKNKSNHFYKKIIQLTEFSTNSIKYLRKNYLPRKIARKFANCVAVFSRTCSCVKGGLSRSHWTSSAGNSAKKRLASGLSNSPN